MADARLTAAKLLMKMDSSDAYSNILLDGALAESGLSERDRAFAAALFYGATERKMTLDYIIAQNSKTPFKKLDSAVVTILRMGFYQLLYMEGVPESAAVNESVKLCKKLGVMSAGGFVNGLLRSFIRNKKRVDYKGLSKSERLSTEFSAPLWLAEKLINEYGLERAVQALEVSLGKPPVYARVNTIKCSDDELIKALSKEGISAEKHSEIEHCLKLGKTGDLEKSKAFSEGLFHIQDISSQLCCLTLRPIVNETVLDMCAAPGGKTFTMAQLMLNRGRIISMDLHDARVGLIRSGAQRLGIRIVEAVQNDASVRNDGIPEADRVLCDVPCSGLGVIRRKPEIKYKNPAEFEELPKIQRAILDNAALYVKPGGTLVYSTCTLSRAENDDVAEAFLKSHPDFTPLVQPVPYAGAENSYKRTYFPTENGGDGFFTASFRRNK